KIDPLARFVENHRGRNEQLRLSRGVFPRFRCSLGGCHMLGRFDEFAKLFVGHRVPIHPEALDCHFVRRRFLGIVLIRPHEKSAAGNPDHVLERSLSWRFRLCRFSRSHGHATTHNFFLFFISPNLAPFAPLRETFLRNSFPAKHVSPSTTLRINFVEGTPSTQRIAQAEVCLAKSSKAVYWTLVQYGKGYRSLRK